MPAIFDQNVTGKTTYSFNPGYQSVKKLLKECKNNVFKSYRLCLFLLVYFIVQATKPTQQFYIIITIIINNKMIIRNCLSIVSNNLGIDLMPLALSIFITFVIYTMIVLLCHCKNGLVDLTNPWSFTL